MEADLVQIGGKVFKLSKETQAQLTAAKAATEGKPTATGNTPKPPTEAPKPPTEAPKPSTEAPKPSTEAPKPPTETTTTTEAPKPKASRYRLASKKAPAQAQPTESLDESLSHEEKLVRFFKGRKENPDKYTYSADGNLVVLDDSGQPSTTIPTRSFRSLTTDEVIELSKQRMEEVRKYESGAPGEEGKSGEPLSYTEAIANLRKVFEKYKRGEETARAVVDANKEVKEAELRRNKALHPIKYVETIENPVIKKILVNSKDERHIGYPVYRIGFFSFKKEDAFGHYVTPEEEASKSSMKGGSSIDVILIESYEDPVRGFLHPAYTKDFSYTSTQYSSVYQAFEVERLKILKNQFLVEQLMKTRSPRTIFSLASQDKTPLPNSFDLWLSILKAYYQQNTDLAKKLVETGSAIFSLRDNIVSSPSDYLNALMSVRSMMAEGQEGGATAPIEKRVITQEEQKKARVGAIINNRRFGAN